MTTTSPNFTPKRKRGEDLWLSPIQFSFRPDTSSVAIPDDGGSSPRSRVVHKFRGLALESGGGATGSDDDNDDNDDNDDDDSDAKDAESIRKRMRLDVVMQDVLPPAGNPAEPQGTSIAPAEDSLERQPDIVREDDMISEPPKTTDTSDFGAVGSLQHAYPSINRLSESKSKIKKRTGSPPLRMKRPTRRPFGDVDEEEMEIVDPVRAALTWHEDEITVYDPEDKDDDGTGINGIGFKPTPALAQARATRRRQQIAEYRKREENEARARRNQRRRRGSGTTVRSGDKSPLRKVRFMDGEANSIAITTG